MEEILVIAVIVLALWWISFQVSIKVIKVLGLDEDNVGE